MLEKLGALLTGSSNAVDEAIDPANANAQPAKTVIERLSDASKTITSKVNELIAGSETKGLLSRLSLAKKPEAEEAIPTQIEKLGRKEPIAFDNSYMVKGKDPRYWRDKYARPGIPEQETQV